jgi:hypothetical protein
MKHQGLELFVAIAPKQLAYSKHNKIANAERRDQYSAGKGVLGLSKGKGGRKKKKIAPQESGEMTAGMSEFSVNEGHASGTELDRGRLPAATRHNAFDDADIHWQSNAPHHDTELSRVSESWHCTSSIASCCPPCGIQRLRGRPGYFTNIGENIHISIVQSRCIARTARRE